MRPLTLVLLGALSLAGCSSDSEDCGTPADPSGTWDYTASQSTPAATIIGSWVLSHPETCRVGGTFSATVDEGDGSPGLLSGTVSGIFLNETHLEIHLYPAGGGDRVHLATLVADTMTGSWEQPGAGAGMSGSFRVERTGP